MSKWEIIRDSVGTILLATAFIVFGTNAVTDDWNIWALIYWLGN